MNQAQPSKIDIWILASRPKTLWAAVAPVVIGTALAYEANGFHSISTLMALFGAVMIQIGTNFANDFFDYKQGVDQKERLGPTRVTQAGLIKPSTMKTATFIVFTLAIIAGIYLVWRGGWPIVIIGLLSILSGILYTASPYSLGYIGLGDIFVLIFFGPIAVGGTYYVQTLEMNNIVIIAGFAPGLFSVAILTVNNLRDLKNDMTAGKKTLAVRFGVNFSRMEYLFSIIIACLIPFMLFVFYHVHPFSSLTMLVVLTALPSVKKVFTTEGKILNDVLAATGRLLLLYSLIFSVGWVL